MGFLKRLITGVQDFDSDRENIDDDRTTDRYLRSLRRQRRTQMEELEKQHLQKQIKEYELKRANLLNKAHEQKAYLLKKKKEQLGYFQRTNL